MQLLGAVGVDGAVALTVQGVAVTFVRGGRIDHCPCYDSRREESGRPFRILKSSINDQVVMCTDINLAIDHQWWRELDRASQGIPRGILVCVIELS